MKVGIIDWGIGGVGLMNKIRANTSADILYFSDTGYTPYGKVREQELKDRLQFVIDYLQVNDCDHIAVACNAASTVLPVHADYTGVIKPAIDMVKKMNLKKLGIVGGKRTIESEIYKKELEQFGMEIQQQVAQPLSARIESGDLHSDDLKKEIREIFTPLKSEKHILLACTHYPVIAKQILEFIPETTLVDPITSMYEEMKEKLQSSRGHGHIQWLTSGNILEMGNVLKIVYGINANTIERRNL